MVREAEGNAFLEKMLVKHDVIARKRVLEDLAWAVGTAQEVGGPGEPPMVLIAALLNSAAVRRLASIAEDAAWEYKSNT